MEKIEYNFNQLPSPMSIDLALNRINLAALTALGNGELNDADRSNAQILKDFFLRELENIQEINKISPDVVPKNSFREQLEQTLSSLTYRKSNNGYKSVTDLENIISLLDKFVKNEVDDEVLKTLINTIINIDNAEGIKPEVPNVMLD